MTNQLALPKGFEERTQPERRSGKENKLLSFQDRRAAEWRRAADRHAAAGESSTAILLRNEAVYIEDETRG